jgi:hypothetical protein
MQRENIHPATGNINDNRQPDREWSAADEASIELVTLRGISRGGIGTRKDWLTLHQKAQPVPGQYTTARVAFVNGSSTPT